MKQYFVHNGEEWWFDPESKEFEYEGESDIILGVLESMNQYQQISTLNTRGVENHPGEVWEELPPEELRTKVIKSIEWLSGVEIGEYEKSPTVHRLNESGNQ